MHFLSFQNVFEERVYEKVYFIPEKDHRVNNRPSEISGLRKDTQPEEVCTSTLRKIFSCLEENITSYLNPTLNSLNVGHLCTP